MTDKPAHLGSEYAAQFADPAVAAAYRFRPPYPEEAVDLVAGLVGDHDRRLLDIGCGTGDLAIPLAARGLRVDGVDPSGAMLDIARSRSLEPRWILGPIESAPLDPPYGLATAAESLHWTDWDVALPRIRDALAPAGLLVVLDRRRLPAAWDPALSALIARFSTNREYRRTDLVDELRARGLFEVVGTTDTGPVVQRQPVADYVESFHSRNGFSRARMTGAADFDRLLADAVAPHTRNGTVPVVTACTVTWGRIPHGP